MTDASDLKAQVASIQTSLTHIQEDLAQANTERGQTHRVIDDIRERVVRLESASSQTADLPGRIATAEQDNAVHTAVEASQAKMLREIRNMIFSGITAVAVIVGIVATIAGWVTNGT